MLILSSTREYKGAPWIAFNLIPYQSASYVLDISTQAPFEQHNTTNKHIVA